MSIKIAYLGFSVLLGFASVSAEAATYRFTATSASSGILGYMDYDSTVFDGTNSQFVSNTNLLSLNFVNPTNNFTITTIGPPGDSTIFDSTGLLPIVVGGSGFTGGTGLLDGVFIALSNFVSLGTGQSSNLFEDVSWSTREISAVPIPAALPLLASGLGALGFIGWRRKRKAA